MASPVGHSLAGILVCSFFSQLKGRAGVLLILLAILMANFPDFDFLPGIVVGRPALYHRGITHSLGMALIVSLTAALLLRVQGIAIRSMFLLCFLSYTSHLILDFFGPDIRHATARNASIRQWVKAILTWHNLVAMAVEISLIAPLIVLRKLSKNRKWGKAPDWEGENKEP
jgi:hypothetical protein